MIPNRFLWAPVGLVGVCMLALNIIVHVFHVSPVVIFRTPAFAEFMVPILVSIGIVAPMLLIFRGTVYRGIDLILIIIGGIIAGYALTPAGYYIHNDFVYVVLLRAVVFVCGLAMIRAWYVSGLPYRGPGVTVRAT